MIIAATSDYDIPEFNIKTFIKALDDIKEPELLLFCGDMYDYRRPKRYKDIGEILDKIGWKCPVIAIPGNHEFEQDYDKVKESCGKRIIFIDDEALIIKNKIGIVGSKGCLDRPTFWQAGNVIGIEDMYKDRIAKIKDLLSKLKTPTKILMTHYAPTHKTLVGESPSIY
jgi:Icc-related predicted phosphoesterase